MKGILIASLCFLAVFVRCEKDMTRKSIIYDKNTPDVFYCPIHKYTGLDKMIVKARPLKKLCEYEGKPLPEDYKSDCYQNVDESNYACKEKYRIMMRMHPPGSDSPFDSKRMARFTNVDKEYYIMKMDNKFAESKAIAENRNIRVKKRLRKRLTTKF